MSRKKLTTKNPENDPMVEAADRFFDRNRVDFWRHSIGNDMKALRLREAILQVTKLPVDERAEIQIAQRARRFKFGHLCTAVDLVVVQPVDSNYEYTKYRYRPEGLANGGDLRIAEAKLAERFGRSQRAISILGNILDSELSHVGSFTETTDREYFEDLMVAIGTHGVMFKGNVTPTAPTTPTVNPEMRI